MRGSIPNESTCRCGFGEMIGEDREERGGEAGERERGGGTNMISGERGYGASLDLASDHNFRSIMLRFSL